MSMPSLHAAAAAALAANTLDAKLQLTFELGQNWAAEHLSLHESTPVCPITEPGRPARPLLVHPRAVPKRSLGSLEGRIGLLHALAHIEFNTINLALDALYRFRELPPQFYSDWLQVAVEEAQHFQLLHQRLQQLGAQYGDLPAHNGLWEAACRTAHDPLVRMALVPRVLEARGLDVTPGIMQRLRQINDHATIECLEVILREEVGHVAIGSHWFCYLCQQRGLEPKATFRQLLEQYRTAVYPPFNLEARLRAGFTEQELHELSQGIA